MQINPIVSYNIRQNQYSNKKAKVKSSTNISRGFNYIPQYYFSPINFRSAPNLEHSITKLLEKYTQLKLFNKTNSEFIRKLSEKLKQKPIPTIKIGISGEAGSGKSTFSDWISEILKEKYNIQSHIIRRDQYLRDYSTKIKEYGCYNNYSKTGELEGSECVDFERIIENLNKSSLGENFHPKKRNRESGVVEPYDYSITIPPTPVVIVEGISIFGNTELKKVLDATIYADAPDKLISKRWGKRSPSRGKIGEIAKQCYKVTKEKAKIYTIPYKDTSDIVLNTSSDKALLADFIKEFINLIPN